jgi:CRP-like cAMP-binding protein
MVREIDLFKGVSKKFMGEVNKIMKKETCEKGAVLFKTGDPAKNFFILQEGRISICAEDRGHVVSFIRTPGEFFRMVVPA